MHGKRVSLYERLPEIYRTKDAEQLPPDQLKSYLATVEAVFGAIHENIESLYHDLFIETADAWAIPYIGDLLGTSHLAGDAWTLRADVADTIALRRRKGTLGAIELLVYNLTKWGVHCVELRERLVWQQHLNHQRPDAGGPPPYSLPEVKRQTAIRGGTVNLRDPALLALLDTPFDPFAHIADLRPPAAAAVRYNLPNLAIFLWRLTSYRVRVARPVARGVKPGVAPAPAAQFIARFNINPVERPYLAGNERWGAPVRLFNTHRFDLFKQRTGAQSATRLAPSVTQLDETPGPIPLERLTEDAPAGAPAEYVSIETYDPNNLNVQTLDVSDVGLQFHLPSPPFLADETWPKPPSEPPAWRIRGANLCAWETGLEPPLQEREVAIDPVIGRVVFGFATKPPADALADALLVTYSYGAPGPVGAQPIARPPLPAEFQVDHNSPNYRRVNLHEHKSLSDALKGVAGVATPVVVEIFDSLVHELDLSDPAFAPDRVNEDGGWNLKLGASLIIRAADGQRPVIKLQQPLRFRPANVVGADAAEQRRFDAAMSKLVVRLEGLCLVRGEKWDVTDTDRPLVARAAVNRLEMLDSTLDPGNFQQFDGARAPLYTSLRLRAPYGFTGAEELAFNQIPELVCSRSITGPLLIDRGYTLTLSDSIVDAGQGVENDKDEYAVSAAGDKLKGWGPPLRVDGATFLGRVRVESVSGGGGIWVHALEALNNQTGCIKFSYFSGEPEDRLPQNHACVKGPAALLRFNSEIFGQPAYCQLAHTCDRRIREQGPHSDEMGAYGFLLAAHKWRNLQIRFREFMPVGVRPLLIPVT